MTSHADTITRPSRAAQSLPVLAVDALLEPHLQHALAALDGRAPLLAGIARYHLGLADADFRATPVDPTARGKRIRPGVALLCCAAAGGDPAVAAPLAAAIELLHNFTLLHDDIQDESPTRRHRPTAWTLWGVGQAINAGDALFAAAHLPLFRLGELGVAAETVLRLADAFDRMTIAIVSGQVLDLGFEGRPDVTPDDYLGMIAGKTAAIVRYAAWSGALLAGAGDPVADALADFGLALGLGFQVRDDALGIWGEAAATGKAAADDIRRRKQSLPILTLRERADTPTRQELTEIYLTDEIDEAGIRRVLSLLDEHNVRETIEARITAFHDEARTALMAALPAPANSYRDALLALVDSLASRKT